MDFDKDIFISYAHIDDESLIEDKKGWVSEFHRMLDIRLSQLMGVKPVIWRDPALQGNHVFGDEIVDRFSNVAIMISVFSPRYIKSDWCQKELDGFYNACGRNIGFVHNNKCRVFKVVKTPVSLDLQTENVKNVLGYEFYTADPITGRVKEFSPLFNAGEKGYWEKLDDLANDISNFLQELKALDNTIGAGQVPPLSKKNAKSIFLSESSYDTQSIRDSIKRDLIDHGYNILPQGQLPLIGPILKNDVTELMKESLLAIHLVGNNYGIVPEGDNKSIVELQYEIGASESIKDHLARLVWIPENMDPADDRQKVFLQRITSGSKDAITGVDMIKGSIEDFKNVVHDKLKALENRKDDTAGKTADDAVRKMVYLICDAQDLDIVAPLEDYLFNNGIEAVLPIFEGDETEIREDHIESLKNCNGVIIFYGNGNEIWLRTKMRDFMKISGYGRSAPLSFKSVFIAPPLSPVKQRFRTLEADIINATGQFPENVLKSLLSKL